MSDAAQRTEPDDNPYVREPDTDFEAVEDLSEGEAREQAEQLRAAIRYHDYRYYVEADPVIDDRVYDQLFDRLQELEETFDLDREGSPTRRIGGEPVDELESVEHVAPMLSIDSSGEESDVREFDERIADALADEGFDPEERAYVCEPKFDGVSVEVIYGDGEYERAATRGDGEVGDDVTENVRTVRSIPQRLRGDHPEFLAVRGEVFMPREAFSAYNRERVERGEDPFANPRNATAGTIRQLDPSVTAERPLDCFFFEVLDGADFDTQWERHRTLPEWGLKVDDRVERVEDVEDAIDYRDDLLAERDDLDYEIDGAVFKLDDQDACDALGATSRAPRWAFAYKFPARSEETTVRDITVQVGRTGRLTPVALLDPVEVGGVTVSRASLHNPEQIAELDVNVGDRVTVERAGDVIPYVDEVVEKNSEGHFEMPDHCPACDSAVERDGPIAYCTGGLACPAQLRRAIEHYASRDALDIQGLGEKAVDQLVDEGLVEGLPDLYDLDREALAELEGWGETSADNLVSEVEATREPDLAEFLVAIGVPEVGPTTARNLARHFGTFDAVREASEAELREVEDVGPTVAGEIREFFASERNEQVIEALRDHVSPEEAETPAGDELEGLTFVFTGALTGPLADYTRDEAQELVETHGGAATSSVSSNTDYLVIGENPGTRKREDADEHAVPELDSEAFADLLREKGVEVD